MRRNLFAQGAQLARTHGRTLLAAAVLIATLPAQAHAAKLCGWMVETVDPDQGHDVHLWLQSNETVWFLYRIDGKLFYSGDGGDGAVDKTSPDGTTYSVGPGPPEDVWSTSQTLGPGDHIDIIVVIHAFPKDMFDKTPSPVLGQFVYRRKVAEKDEKPSVTTSPHECFEATFPNS